MSYEPLICTIDVGTTSTRAILFTKTGEEISKHQIEYSTSAQQSSRRNSPDIFTGEGIALDLQNDSIEIEDELERPTLIFPQPGWVECDPCLILSNVLQCLACVCNNLEIINTQQPLDNSSIPIYKIATIGIANMRETTIIWSKSTGLPYYNGIVWNDTRTMNLMNRINDSTPKQVLELMRNKSGCPISTYFSALKWLWLYENIDDIRNSYESGDQDLMFGTVDTWLIYNLTLEKSYVTDITNASRTSFMNLEEKNYDDQLLKFWQIDKLKLNLPLILPSSYTYGNFKIPSIDDLKKFKLPKKHKLSNLQLSILNKYLNKIPITGCLGDQSASLVGQLALKKGDAKCTYGTGAFLLYNTGSTKLISSHGAVTTVGYWFSSLDESIDGLNSNQPQYCLEGSIAVAGSCVQWLRDNLKLIGKASDIGPLAAQVPNSAGVVFVPAFSGLFAPYWDSKTTGTIFGLTQYSTASHIARAAIEGVCFQVRAILKVMIQDSGSSVEFLDDRKKVVGDQPLKTLHVDGGMSKSNTVMQIQADILGPCVTVERSLNAECTALGAAIAAGLCQGIEIWSSLDDVIKTIKSAELQENKNIKNTFISQFSDKKRRRFWDLWERAVVRARGWLENVEENLALL
ncbi:hypothetical protein CANARDRAFT_176118 [[Candida] arabinofermentans NRRL YB-2248]|uniref:glycerol kinase n=1 Tax=[Candida] arabinofermentans NRRL YB-2248 TaxID=983967 RepID=A0A1E4T070_9ASCO|nr:hypothetical protein CANARDRAFT_176118 [[Candida] arabinofermentans NRRL YB-2248]